MSKKSIIIFIILMLLIGYGYTADSLTVIGKVVNLVGNGVDNAIITSEEGISSNSDTNGEYTIKISKNFLPVDEQNIQLDNYKECRIKIYDLLGRKIFEKEYLNISTRNYIWNGLDQQGEYVSSGIYFPVLEIKNKIIARTKVTIIGGKVLNNRPFVNSIQNKTLTSLAKRNGSKEIFIVQFDVTGDNFENISNLQINVNDDNNDDIGEAENIEVNIFPIASFIISPDSGTTFTTFSFDASGCSDAEDDISELKVHWDWTNDGLWDTDLETTKIATHKYTSAGVHTVKLEVVDSDDGTRTITNTVTVTDIQNTPPIASFSVYPDSGNTSTSFLFSAYDCSDAEDDIPDLQVRWDWENDSNWDTDYSAAKLINHQYSVAGTYEVKLEVKDTKSLTTSVIEEIFVVEDTNNEPSAFFTILPETGYIGTSFIFDATGSSDIEDEISDLQVRWDWDNDGVWDTDFTTTKLINHQFTSVGIYEVNLEVIDSDNAVNTTSKNVTVNDSTAETGSMTDIDGNTYTTVKIGEQWWMAENLKVTHYRSGSEIQNVTGDTEWMGLSTGSYCIFNNDDNYKDTYGALYNWHAVNDSRKMAPEGWHIPTDDEWKEMEMFIGMSQAEADETGNRGTGLGTKLKSTKDWFSTGEGTDDYGFNALGGGYRNSNGPFYGKRMNEYFWTSSEHSIYTGDAWKRSLNYNSPSIARTNTKKTLGASVRCVKDGLEPSDNPPYASFSVDPPGGFYTTEFTFDASECSDAEDDASLLKVRWDWESDGIWDLSSSTTKIFSYLFPRPGNYTIKLEVEDTDGNTSVTTRTVGVSIPVSTVTDVEGNEYKTIKIGNQWWMAENLRVTHYRNGNPIPYVADRFDWMDFGNNNTGAYVKYAWDEVIFNGYGGLYNWYAVNDGRGLAPEGWHIATDDDWKELELLLGMSPYDVDFAGYGFRGFIEAKYLKAVREWYDHGNGTDDYGFRALPGGARGHDGGMGQLKFAGYWWTATLLGTEEAYFRKMHTGNHYIIRDLNNKEYGMSIRCVKNE